MFQMFLKFKVGNIFYLWRKSVEVYHFYSKSFFDVRAGGATPRTFDSCLGHGMYYGQRHNIYISVLATSHLCSGLNHLYRLDLVIEKDRLKQR